MERKSKLIIIALSIFMLSTYTYCAPGGDMPGGAPGGTSNASVTHTGATTITSDLTEESRSYSSSTGSENALLVTGGTSTISNITLNKSGDASGDEADFYGTNAGVLVKSGTLNIKGGTITTNGSHANAVFAYADGVINISDAKINTSNNNSGAIMVTGGGTLTADNVTAETKGNSSAPIRSDRGGGTLTVNKGTYTSNGTGSPVIYSTADITVNDAKLISNASEGVVVEGKNSVTLNGTTLEATNTQLNGNSETYKAIFIYQSMSGDADEGTSSFTSKKSKITNNKGDVIFVTNTSTVITLENNEIINNDSDGAFLRATSAKWGNSGSNGGIVTLNLVNQDIRGDIILDSISTIDMNMSNKSFYKGAINNNNESSSVKLNISSDSIFVLTEDTYLTSLENEVSDNSNIYANGNKLYVDGKEVSINEDTAPDGIDSNESKEETKVANTNTSNEKLMFEIAGGVCLVLIIGIIILLVRNKKLNKQD